MESYLKTLEQGTPDLFRLRRKRYDLEFQMIKDRLGSPKKDKQSLHIVAGAVAFMILSLLLRLQFINCVL